MWEEELFFKSANNSIVPNKQKKIIILDFDNTLWLKNSKINKQIISLLLEEQKTADLELYILTTRPILQNDAAKKMESIITAFEDESNIKIQAVISSMDYLPTDNIQSFYDLFEELKKYVTENFLKNGLTFIEESTLLKFALLFYPDLESTFALHFHNIEFEDFLNSLDDKIKLKSFYQETMKTLTEAPLNLDMTFYKKSLITNKPLFPSCDCSNYLPYGVHYNAQDRIYIPNNEYYLLKLFVALKKHKTNKLIESINGFSLPKSYGDKFLTAYLLLEAILKKSVNDLSEKTEISQIVFIDDKREELESFKLAYEVFQKLTKETIPLNLYHCLDGGDLKFFDQSSDQSASTVVIDTAKLVLK